MAIWALRDPQGVFLRIYEPTMPYLREPFVHPDAAYLPFEQVVCTIAKHDARHLGTGWADRPWVYPEEVRLLAAIALSVPEGCGMLGFAPLSVHRRMNLDYTQPLDTPDVLKSAESIARALIVEKRGKSVRYELRDTEHSGTEYQHRLFDAIDPGNSLLIRSLYALLKSQHLARDGDGVFFEEAAMNVQIAREGALELLRDQIPPTKRKRPTEKDAFAYLKREFRHGAALAHYLDDQRQRWVKTKHPRSDLGVFWAPPLEADDFYETYQAVVSILRHILTGEAGRETACFE